MRFRLALAALKATVWLLVALPLAIGLEAVTGYETRGGFVSIAVSDIVEKAGIKWRLSYGLAAITAGDTFIIAAALWTTYIAVHYFRRLARARSELR